VEKNYSQIAGVGFVALPAPVEQGMLKSLQQCHQFGPAELACELLLGNLQSERVFVYAVAFASAIDRQPELGSEMAHQFEIAVACHRVRPTDDGTAEEPCKYTESTVTGGYDGQRSCFLGEHYCCFQGLAAEARGRTWEICAIFCSSSFSS